MMCEYASSKRSDLAKHIKSVHEKKRDFECAWCDYSASAKVNLAQHVRGVHEKRREFKCTECDYAASQKWILAQHIRGGMLELFAMLRRFEMQLLYRLLIIICSIQSGRFPLPTELKGSYISTS